MSNTYLTVPTVVRARFRKADGPDSPVLFRGAMASPTAAMREELLATSRQPELMIRFLAEMDRKLDALLSMLQSESLSLEFPQEGHVVELSGNGLVLECNHGLAEGSYLELLLMLEEYPMRIVPALCRVTGNRDRRALPCMHDHAFDLRFERIEEDDREAVIRFVFSEDRKRIRQQKNEG